MGPLGTLGHSGVSSRLQQLDVRGSRQVHDARAPFGRIERQKRHLAHPGYRSLDRHPRQLALELHERRGQARALEESAPGSRDRPHRLRREEPSLPDAVGLLMGNDPSPMGFAHPLKSRLDPGCPLLWVSTDKHVPFLEASGASHGGVQEAQMPERHPASVEVKDGISKVPRISEDRSDGHVLSCAPRRLEPCQGLRMPWQTLYNPLVNALLRSSLHGFMGRSTLLFTYTGRKSGKAYTTPVNYLRDGDTLLVVSSCEHIWWKNLRAGAPVAVRVRGYNERDTRNFVGYHHNHRQGDSGRVKR